MSDTETAPSAEEPRGLDAIINDAIETHYEPDDTPKEAPTEAASDTQAARDEKGRFAPKITEAKPSEPGTADAPVDTAEATQPDPALAPVEAPRNFTADAKAKFAALPKEAQAIVREVEQAREAEYTRRSQEIAEYRRTADPLMDAIKPFTGYLQQLAPQVGSTPDRMIAAMLSTEHQLRTAPPQQRYQAFATLAQTYGIDLAAFANGQMPVHSQQTQQPYLDPQLQHRLASVEQMFAEQKSREELQYSNQLVEAFGSEKDEAGSPKHPYFDRVRAVMASIIQSGQAETLEDAYTMATAPIKDVIDKELKARQEALEKERSSALEKAKKAAPVRTSSGSLPKGANTAKGLDAHITAAMEKAGF